MKTIKKQILGILIFLIGTLSYAQSTTQNDKFKYHSFSITPLEVFFNEYSGGLAITGELSYAINNNIFSFSATLGEEIGIFGRGERFQQLNVLYGRELKLKEWLFVDVDAGVGLFRLNDDHHSDASLGLPIVTKLRFKTSDKFSIGLKLQGNINSVENIYSIGLLLRWNN